jgi:hypothetical protein
VELVAATEGMINAYTIYVKKYEEKHHFEDLGV